MTLQRRADAAIAIATFAGLLVVWPADGSQAAMGWLLLMFAARWTVRVLFCLSEFLGGK
jgi:hypothetical protein